MPAGGAHRALGRGRRRAPRGAQRAIGAVLLRTAAAAWLCALALGCARRAETSPPSIVLVSIDTLRPDHLGAYGYRRATSPALDALAADGVLFEHAYTPSSWTLPGHASMLSGVSPYRHGANLETSRIRDDVPLLAERLRARGYATAAIVGAPFVGAGYGFARGFDRFVERFAEGQDVDAYAAAVDEAVRALPQRPFFLFVHFMSVHSPYTPPPRFDRFKTPGAESAIVDPSRLGQLQRALEQHRAALSDADRDRLIDLYDGEIAAVDDAFARLRRAVRDAHGENVVFVVTSDHGEEFLEHGGVAHGSTLYDEVLRVPLLAAGPGIERGRRVAGMVSLLDVAPTLLGLAGADGDAGMDGRSLVAVLSGGQATGGAGGDAAARGGGAPPSAAPDVDLTNAPTLALQTNAHDGRVALRGVRQPAAKLVRDDAHGSTVLFDLAADPGEHAARDAAGPAAQALIAALDRLAPGPASASAPPAQLALPDARTRAALEALGYLGPSEAKDGDRPAAAPGAP